MARAGLRALEFYDPATKKHGQAHMQARYVYLLVVQFKPFTSIVFSLGITQHLIKSGIAHLEEIRGADGKLENLYVRVRLSSSSVSPKTVHLLPWSYRFFAG